MASSSMEHVNVNSTTQATSSQPKTDLGTKPETGDDRPPPTYNEATEINTKERYNLTSTSQFVDTSQVKPKKQHKGGFGFGLPSQVKPKKQHKGGFGFAFKCPSFKGTSSSPTENVDTTVEVKSTEQKKKKKKKSGSGFHLPSFS